MRLHAAGEVHSARDMNEDSTWNTQKRTRGKYFVFISTLIFVFIMSNEENRTDITAEETKDTDSSRHILKHSDNSEISQ